MAFILLIVAGTFPLFSYPFILSYYFRTRKAKTSSLLVGFASSAFIYGYISDQGNDIVRHMLNLRYYADKSLLHAFDAGHYRMLYIWDIWQWIIAHLHNEYLMQASGALVGYTLLAYMIFDCGKIYEYSNRTIKLAFVLLFLSVSPLSMAIGIRSGNALVFCALAMYLCFVKGKNYLLTLGLLAVSVFLHHSMIIVFAFWIVFYIFRKKPVIGAILMAIVIFTFTNYEAYISAFMGGGSMFELIGDDLQRSVIAYTGVRLQNFHNTVTTIMQGLLVIALYVRGGGYCYHQIPSSQCGNRRRQLKPSAQSVPVCFHCSGYQPGIFAFI